MLWRQLESHKSGFPGRNVSRWVKRSPRRSIKKKPIRLIRIKLRKDIKPKCPAAGHLEPVESLELSYVWYIHVIWPICSYTCHIWHIALIYFPIILIFLSHRVDIWHPSKLPIHTMSLYIRGDYFLKRYTVLKMAVVYDKYKPNICLVYAKIFVFFNELRFYWRNNNEIATAGLNQYVLIHSEARDITQSLEKHVLLSSHIW